MLMHVLNHLDFEKRVASAKRADLRISGELGRAGKIIKPE